MEARKSFPWQQLSHYYYTVQMYREILDILQERMFQDKGQQCKNAESTAASTHP